MKRVVLVVLISLLFVGCSGIKTDKAFKVIADGSKGTHVNIYTSSDDGMKLYLEKNFKKNMEQKYNIDVNVRSMNYDAIKNTLATYEKDGVVDGEMDLLILNKDEFECIIKYDYFYKNITKDMSNFNETINEIDQDFEKIRDFKDRVIAVPLYRKQLVFLYDNDVLEKAPKDLEGFMEFIKENKNTFTFPNPLKDDDGMQFLNYIIFNTLSDEELIALRTEVDKNKIKALLSPSMKLLKEMDDYILKDNNEYYDSMDDINTLFKEGSVYFSFSNDFSGILDDVAEVYPYNLNSFMMGKTAVETYYVLVPNTAKNKGGAFVLINDLISYDVQLDMVKHPNLKVLPILDINLLNAEKKAEFKYNDKFVQINDFIDNREYSFSKKTRDMIKDIFKEMLDNKKKELQELKDEKEKEKENIDG